MCVDDDEVELEDPPDPPLPRPPPGIVVLVDRSKGGRGEEGRLETRGALDDKALGLSTRLFVEYL